MCSRHLHNIVCFFLLIRIPSFSFFFFFNDTATTEIYTLSLHDALPISQSSDDWPACSGQRSTQFDGEAENYFDCRCGRNRRRDRKSRRLNSSHLVISYAVFCLKKKKKKEIEDCIIFLVSEVDL